MLKIFVRPVMGGFEPPPTPPPEYATAFSQCSWASWRRSGVTWSNFREENTSLAAAFITDWSRFQLVLWNAGESIYIYIYIYMCVCVRVCVCVYTSYMYICPRTFYFEYFCVHRRIYFIHLFYNVPIWLFCNVYIVADNDVIVSGRALHYNATLSLATGFCYLHNI